MTGSVHTTGQLQIEKLYVIIIINFTHRPVNTRLHVTLIKLNTILMLLNRVSVHHKYLHYQ